MCTLCLPCLGATAPVFTLGTKTFANITSESTPIFDCRCLVKVQLVKGVTSDAAEISQILEDWAEATSWLPTVDSAIERADYGRWLLEHTQVTILRYNSQFVGFLALEGNIVQSLYIKAAFQRLGFGQAAINYAQEQYNELKLWVFQANTDAQKFYQKLGFEALETTNGQDNDYGLPDIFYLWELPDI